MSLVVSTATWLLSPYQQCHDSDLQQLHSGLGLSETESINSLPSVQSGLHSDNNNYSVCDIKFPKCDYSSSTLPPLIYSWLYIHNGYSSNTAFFNSLGTESVTSWRSCIWLPGRFMSDRSYPSRSRSLPEVYQSSIYNTHLVDYMYLCQDRQLPRQLHHKPIWYLMVDSSCTIGLIMIVSYYKTLLWLHNITKHASWLHAHICMLATLHFSYMS